MRWLLIPVLAVMVLSTMAVGQEVGKMDERTYAYFYLMQGQPEEIGRLAPRHAEYWKGLHLKGYRGGPFADYSGGLIVFRARDEGQARKWVAGDPFVTHGVIGESRLKAWRVD